MFMAKPAPFTVVERRVLMGRGVRIGVLGKRKGKRVHDSPRVPILPFPLSLFSNVNCVLRHFRANVRQFTHFT